MANILIRDVDPLIIQLLDELVAAERYSSRNQLLQEIVRQYVTNRHEFFSKSLVPTVKYLAQEAISEHENYVERGLDAVANININVLKKLDKMYALFENELNEYASEQAKMNRFPP